MRTRSGRTDLVGREAELALAERALASVAPALGHALLITGEPGIGKSELLDALLDGAAGRRYRVAVEAASELEADLPFAPLVRALCLRPGSSDPDAAALGSLLADPAGSDPELLRLRVIEGIADLVERWALERPVLLAVEDLQWADEATLQTLDRLARRLAHIGVLIAGTARHHPDPPALRVLERTLAAAGATTIALAPLPEDVVGDLAEQVLGGEPGPQLRRALGRAGGNPLYVTELLTAARDRAAPGGEAIDLPAGGVPESVRQTILRNLTSLPAATVAVLRIAAVLGTRFDLFQLAVTLDRPAADVADVLAPAIASQVVSEAGDRLVFRHDLVREAVYEDQPRAVRAATHRRVVERLRLAKVGTEELIPHLLRGRWSGEPEAVGWLHEAGRTVRGRSLPLATGLLTRAVDLAGPAATPELRLDLAEALAAADRPDAVAVALGPVLSGPLDALTGPVRDRLVAFAGPLLGPTRPSGERTALLDALEAAGLSVRGRGRAMSARAWLAWVEGRRDDAIGLASQALELATGNGDHAEACTLELLLARLQEGSGLLAPAFERVRSALAHARLVPSRPELELTASATLALILGNDADLRPEAARVISDAQMLADRTGLEGHQAGLEAVAALNAQRQGAWRTAADRYEVALEGLSGGEVPAVGPSMAALLHARAARLDIHRDELELARARLGVAREISERSLASDQGQDELIMVRLAEAELQLALGDPDATAAAVRAIETFVDERGIPVFHARMLPAITAIAWCLDRRDDAAAAVERAERTLRDLDVIDPDLSVIVEWCRARLAGDSDALDRLVDWADGPRALWEWRPMVREDAAAVLVASGRTDRATERLEEAMTLWEDAGAARDVARVRMALRALGVRRGRGLVADRPETGWDSLTDAEWRVVELVEQGLIYREIGARLFISRRTVETHVQHVFRKLGVSSRGELATLMARVGGGRRPGRS